MEISYDFNKDAANQRKHGVSLANAANIEWETMIAVPDIRRNYGEPRMIGLAYIGLRLFCVIYTDRDQVRRVISLRKANKREVCQYARA